MIVAGVDASTQSTTVELRDAETGRLLGTGRAPHPRTTPPVSEQAPAEWWRALAAALALAADAAGIALTEVRAIGVAAQCHGLVLLDAAGRPLRDAKLWNDTTSAPQAARLLERRSSEAWARAVGSVPIAAFTISKLAWVAEHEPTLLERARHVLLPHDYLTWRLTGRATTDRSDASGTGYYAAHDGSWRPELLEEHVAPIDWLPLLPEVLGPDAVAGEVIPAAAAELGLAHGTLVSVGGGDQHLGALGLGLRSRDVAYSLGTSGVVLTVSEDPVFDGSGEVTGVADCTGRYLPLACTLNATKVTDWAAGMLGVGVEALGAMALDADPGDPRRPVLAAHLDGERTPNLPDATGTLAGLTTATTRSEFARAAFEGVLLGLVRAHGRLHDLGAPADGEVVLMGGGARSAAYRQILADLLGQPVVLRDADEATARGAAVQAAATVRAEPVEVVAEALRPAARSVTEPARAVPASVVERYAAAAAWRGGDREAG